MEDLFIKVEYTYAHSLRAHINGLAQSQRVYVDEYDEHLDARGLLRISAESTTELEQIAKSYGAFCTRDKREYEKTIRTYRLGALRRDIYDMKGITCGGAACPT